MPFPSVGSFARGNATYCEIPNPLGEFSQAFGERIGRAQRDLGGHQREQGHHHLRQCGYENLSDRGLFCGFKNVLNLTHFGNSFRPKFLLFLPSPFTPFPTTSDSRLSKQTQFAWHPKEVGHVPFRSIRPSTFPRIQEFRRNSKRRVDPRGRSRVAATSKSRQYQTQSFALQRLHPHADATQSRNRSKCKLRTLAVFGY